MRKKEQLICGVFRGMSSFSPLLRTDVHYKLHAFNVSAILETLRERARACVGSAKKLAFFFLSLPPRRKKSKKRLKARWGYVLYFYRSGTLKKSFFCKCTNLLSHFCGMLPLEFSPAAFPVCTVAARFASPSFHCSAGRKIDCLIILFPPFAGPSPPGAASPGPARRTATRTPTATGGANRAALRQVETAAAAQGAEAAAAAGSAAVAERGRSTTTGGQGISIEKIYLFFVFANVSVFLRSRSSSYDRDYDRGGGGGGGGGGRKRDRRKGRKRRSYSRSPSLSPPRKSKKHYK